MLLAAEAAATFGGSSAREEKKCEQMVKYLQFEMLLSELLNWNEQHECRDMTTTTYKFNFAAAGHVHMIEDFPPRKILLAHQQQRRDLNRTIDLFLN